MLDKETYLNVLTRYFDSIREDSDESVPNCADVSCENCMFNNSDDACLQGYNVYNALEKLEEWSKKHPKPEYKVSKTEYDILRTVIDYSVEDDTFDDFCTLSGLLEKGYFKGANLTMNIREYYKNCEVVDK